MLTISIVLLVTTFNIVTILFTILLTIIEGFGKTILFCLKKFTINNALFSRHSKRNLLSFKDIHSNGYHIETSRKNEIEHLYIIYTISNGKCVVENLSTLYSEYYTHIQIIEIYSTMNLKFMTPNIFVIWHDILGHSGSIIIKNFIDNSRGHPLNNQNILQYKKLSS